ncbi:MAG: peptidyl-prolyl cis-trans isomerase, partial [Kiloniellales bacterium]
MPSKSRNFLAKVVTFVLFGLLILSFAIWGIGDVFRGATGGTTIVEAGPVEIDQRVYERELARSVNQLSAQFGGQIDRRQLLSFGIGDQVLAQLVGRAVIDAEAQELGLVVTDAMVTDVLTDASAFGDGQGGFNRAAFAQYLFRTQQSEEEYLASLRGQILRSNLTGALTGGLATPEVLARRLFDYREETRIAQYLRLDTAAFADEVPAPEEAALAAFYEENTASFMAPERRQLTYLRIDPEELTEEIAVSEEAIAEAYAARLHELSTPERRHLEQLLFDDRAAAQAAAERIAGGADFAALAGELKLGAPIDLGTLARDELEQASPALAEAAFGVAAGEVAGPVESPLGWHLVKVLAVEAGKEPTLDELRETLKHDLARADAVEAVISLANRLDDTLGGGATLEEAGPRLGLAVHEIPAVDRQGNDVNGQPLADLPPGDVFLQTAFELGAGEESLLTETERGGYFVVRVDDVTASAPRPLEEVRDQL